MTPTLSHDITCLRSLLERCEAAEGPDRELDVELWCLGKGGRLRDADAGMYLVEEPIDGFWIRSVKKLRDFPRYTASIDAAVMAIEKVLPGVNVAMGWGEPHRNPWATISPLAEDGRHPHSAGGYNQALALLSALLKAIIAREEQRAGEEKEVVG